MKIHDYGLWIKGGERFYTRDQFVGLLKENRGITFSFCICHNGQIKKFSPEDTLDSLCKSEIYGTLVSSMREWIKHGWRMESDGTFSVLCARMD